MHGACRCVGSDLVLSHENVRGSIPDTISSLTALTYVSGIEVAWSLLSGHVSPVLCVVAVFIVTLQGSRPPRQHVYGDDTEHDRRPRSHAEDAEPRREQLYRDAADIAVLVDRLAVPGRFGW